MSRIVTLVSLMLSFSYIAPAMADDEISLFDGTTLSGWEVRPSESTEEHWKVEDQMIVAENANKKGSDLWTIKPFGDYELELEFMTPSDYYDSGVFPRGTSHQVQIGISGSLQIDLTACIYAPIDGQGSYPAKSDKVTKINRPGQWNQLRIVVQGKHIDTFLNGEPFVAYDAIKFPEKGPIGLQLHQGHHMKIMFRNFKLVVRGDGSTVPATPSAAASPSENPSSADTSASIASPPRVISTMPPIGATGVKTKYNELIVSFDRDMDTGMSWTGGPPHFPPVDSARKARWIDARNCALPVELEAGKFYRVGINSTSYQNFRDTSGTPALPIVLCFTTAGAAKEIEAMVAPPSIVSCSPENGATDVDPETKMVTVTFDRPMAAGMSWTGAAQDLPEQPVGKKASWSDDQRTCQLPVQLQPSRHYRLGINSLSHINFQSATGVPAAPVVYEFETK